VRSFKDLLMIDGTVVEIRCGGSGGRCGALHGAVIPNGEDVGDALFLYRTDRPCRHFVSLASLDMEELGGLVPDMLKRRRSGSYAPIVYMARPEPGRLHRDPVEDLEHLQGWCMASLWSAWRSDARNSARFGAGAVTEFSRRGQVFAALPDGVGCS
jgi:hypothetical protein